MQDKINKLHWMQSGEKRFKGTVGQSGNGTSLPGGGDDPGPGNPDQMTSDQGFQVRDRPYHLEGMSRYHFLQLSL